MKAFADLFARLDGTTSTNGKVAAMAAYFEGAPADEAAWAFFLLSGRRIKRLIGPRKLGGWALEEAALPEWLMDECYAAVGDLAEVIALLVDQEEARLERTLPEWVAALKGLRRLEEDAQRERVVTWWRSLPPAERFLLNKLLTGALRVGVSKTLAIRALAEATGIDRDVLQHRLSGKWAPSAEAWEALVDPEAGDDVSAARPYPFYLASPLEASLAELGEPSDWLIEWKWDGIRAQLVRRQGQTFLWSRGEELITDRFPEIEAASEALADGTVLDGELLAWDAAAGRPLPFAKLQKRIGRKKLGPKILKEAPAHFMAYDLLELGGEDQRARSQSERRTALEETIAGLDGEPAERFGISERVEGESWEAIEALHQESRARGVEGFMLKRASGPYRTGRRKGEWWKHKVDPFTLDCVLIYAQAGSGKRAGLFTDYTFALRSAEHGLVPIAKAYSGLDDAEIRELDGWIRSHTLERFGPVRAVEPAHVFEIAFEDIRESKRHKAGLAVRFPRIQRWRRDKAPEDADSLASARAVLAAKGD